VPEETILTLLTGGGGAGGGAVGMYLLMRRKNGRNKLPEMICPLAPDVHHMRTISPDLGRLNERMDDMVSEQKETNSLLTDIRVSLAKSG
jgi:hypothetical protein